MPVIYFASALLALGLFVYLVCAMLAPEKF